MKKLALLFVLLGALTYAADSTMKDADHAFKELDYEMGDGPNPNAKKEMTREERNKARREAEAKGEAVQTPAPSAVTATEPAAVEQAPQTEKYKESTFTPQVKDKPKHSLYKYIGVARAQGLFTETYTPTNAARTLDYNATKVLLGLFLPTVNMKLEIGISSITLSDTFNNTAPALEIDYDLMVGSGSTSGMLDAFYYLRLGLVGNSIEYANFTTSGYGWRIGAGADIVLFEKLDLFIDYTYMSIASKPENATDTDRNEAYGLVSAGLNYFF